MDFGGYGVFCEAVDCEGGHDERIKAGSLDVYGVGLEACGLITGGKKLFCKGVELRRYHSIMKDEISIFKLKLRAGGK